MTVVRVWKGYGSPDGVERYCREHFVDTVLPQLRVLDGFVAAHLLVRSLAGETEVVAATEWASFEAIAAFAGTDAERAVVEPAVRDLLTRYDDRVHHYSSVFSSG